MIGKLKGKIDLISDDYLILDINGVGYLVYTSKLILSSLIQGEAIELFIETHVREDHIKLYGFSTISEKNCFSILQLVKGVGAKMALAILSKLNVHQIQNALISQDKNAFSGIAGVGKKIIDRLLIELKDKIISNDFSDIQIGHSRVDYNNNIVQDAVAALISLGINKNEATNRVGNIMSNNPEITINELIKVALQN